MPTSMQVKNKKYTLKIQKPQKYKTTKIKQNKIKGEAHRHAGVVRRLEVEPLPGRRWDEPDGGRRYHVWLPCQGFKNTGG